MDLEKLWRSVLVEIELSISKPIFKTQFAQTTLVSLEHNIATVGCPNNLMRTLVESRYYSLIKTIVDQRTRANNSLLFVVATKKALAAGEAGPLFNQALEPLATSAADLARRIHVRPDATFDNFAVSTTNQLAYAAATAVARAPGSAYNPLFLYGGVGVGKTHLMHAVANALIAKRPTTRVVYSMGEEFLNEIVEAIQTKTARQFKQKYRSSQLLLVDDVQFIAGKQTAQEEFFHTFNAVHREGGQIILTSDRPPGEISKLEDRLRSRFEGGLAVDISPPNFELRVAIVNIKALAMGLSVAPDSAQAIAAHITDTRALEGFLRKLLAARPAPITPELVSSLLGTGRATGGAPVGTRRVSPQEVVDAVASYFNIKPTTIRGPKRDRPISRPRQIIMYLCKTELGLTHNDIGGLLGGRDHTTIMHGVDAISRDLSTNERLRENIVGIKQKLWA